MLDIDWCYWRSKILDKLSSELRDLFRYFVISFLLLTSFLLIYISSVDEKIPESFQIHISWKTLVYIFQEVWVPLSIAIGSLAIVLTLATGIWSVYQASFFQAALGKTFVNNRGAYSMRKSAVSPFTIYLVNTTGFEDDKVEKHIYSSCNAKINILRLEGEKLDSKLCVLDSLHKADVSIFVLGSSTEIQEISVSFSLSNELDKTVFVLLEKNSNGFYSQEIQALLSKGTANLKLAFFESIENLEREIELLLTDEFLDAIRNRSRKENTPRVVNRVNEELIS